VNAKKAREKEKNVKKIVEKRKKNEERERK